MRASRSAFVALLLLSTTAHAAGVNLSWDLCSADGPPVYTKSFVCVSDAGSEQAVASFVCAGTHVVGGLMEAQIDIQTRSGIALPAWWDFGTSTSCRRNLITFDGTAPNPVVACQPTYPNPAFPPRWFVVRDDFRVPTPGHMSIVVSASLLSPLSVGVEYFACRLVISHLTASGLRSCAGCLEPVAITLTQLNVGSNHESLTTPVSSNVVYWQDFLPVPTRNVSWGAIKTLYR